MEFNPLATKRFGKLSVVREYCSRRSGGRSVRKLECQCDCGKITNPEKGKVLNGITKSCGCIQVEMRKNLGNTRRLPDGVSLKNQVFEVYRKSARVRGYKFSLSKEEFVDIVTKPCIYCGDSLQNELIKDNASGSFKYTGIDRYDNSIGYTIENSVPCCRVCNRIKTNMTTDTLHKHMLRMLDNAHLWYRKI